MELAFCSLLPYVLIYFAMSINVYAEPTTFKKLPKRPVVTSTPATTRHSPSVAGVVRQQLAAHKDDQHCHSLLGSCQALAVLPCHECYKENIVCYIIMVLDNNEVLPEIPLIKSSASVKDNMASSPEVKTYMSDRIKIAKYHAIYINFRKLVKAKKNKVKTSCANVISI